MEDAKRKHINDVVQEWAPKIHYHAHDKSKTYPHIDKEDLYAAGVHGLMSAFATYDPAKGASFKTHAETRIKGAMQDHITGIHSHGTGGVDPYHLREAKKFMQRKPAEPPAMPSSDDLPPPIPTSKK